MQPKPNPDTLDQSLPFFTDLMARINRPHRWISRNSGISLRRILYLSKGERPTADGVKPCRITFPEQWVLECLANDERDR